MTSLCHEASRKAENQDEIKDMSPFLVRDQIAIQQLQAKFRLCSKNKTTKSSIKHQRVDRSLHLTVMIICYDVLIASSSSIMVLNQVIDLLTC